MVLIPTITSSTVSISMSRTAGGTYYPLYILDDDATGNFASATSAATTTMAISFETGGAQYIKILCGSAQTTTDKTFYVMGYN